MKTLSVVILFFSFSLIAQAQLKKGHLMIGGTADFSHRQSDYNLPGLDHESKTTSYRLSPGIGVFLIDRLCGGLRIDVGNSKMTDDYSSSNPNAGTSHAEAKTSVWGITPFLRYYFLHANHKVNLFADASYSHGKEKTRIETSFTQINPPPAFPTVGETLSKTTYNSNSLSIAAGPVFFINPKVSFELSLGYTHRSAKKQNLSSNMILFGTGFQVYLGK
jgi:hypothetical protein